MRRGSLTILCLLLAAGPTAAFEIDDLSWLQGHWAAAEDGRVVEELWLAPAAGMMLGVGRTARGEVIELHEFFRIEQRGDQVVYCPFPNGRAGVEFAAVALDLRHAVFANPEHDFPQRIEYRRKAPDQLEITVSGPDNRLVYTLERR